MLIARQNGHIDQAARMKSKEEIERGREREEEGEREGCRVNAARVWTYSSFKASMRAHTHTHTPHLL